MCCMTAQMRRLFPAHAGMNRLDILIDHRPLSVPRTRGDEPGETLEERVADDCSPHTRG